MMDKVLLIWSPLAEFSTAPWGYLKVVDGQVVLDKVKVFNTARLMLNSGANTIRILRRGIWDTVRPFDWTDAGYWDLLREYVEILHNPVQGAGAGPGAEIHIDIFDGCGKSEEPGNDKQWIYSDHDKAKELIRKMFSYLGDLPYVKFRIGNELNQPAVVDFNMQVAYPEFREAGRWPANYGPGLSDKEDLLEKVKAKADDYWHLDSSKIIYRDIHGVKDSQSPMFKLGFSYWLAQNHPIRHIYSCDGVKPRPTVAEWRSVMRYALDYGHPLEIPEPLDTKIKLGFEYLGEIYQEEDTADHIWAMAEEYKATFGTWPENYGRYPNDWVEPLPPEPTPPPYVQLDVCVQTGLLPNHSCSKIRKVFPYAEQPTAVCPIHHDATIWERIWEWIKGHFQ